MERDTLGPVNAFREQMQRRCSKRYQDYLENPNSFKGKSWEGYLNNHLNQPAKGQEALQAAKVIVAIQALREDEKNSSFSVKEARNRANDVLKNPLYRDFFKDKQKLDEMLRKRDVKEIEQAFTESLIFRKAETSVINDAPEQKQPDNVSVKEESRESMSAPVGIAVKP